MLYRFIYYLIKKYSSYFLKLDYMGELHKKLIENLSDIVLLSSDILPDDDSEGY